MNAKLKNKKNKIENLHFNEIDYYPEYPLNLEENIYNFKFNVKKIKTTDKLFIEINSTIKILVDLHADSDQDGFSRFSKLIIHYIKKLILNFIVLKMLVVCNIIF